MLNELAKKVAKKEKSIKSGKEIFLNASLISAATHFSLFLTLAQKKVSKTDCDGKEFSSFFAFQPERIYLSSDKQSI